MRSAQDLLEELNASDESPRIEAKRAREAGKSLLETVISFANEPGLQGGWILLGVSGHVNEKGDRVYLAEGVPDPDKLQLDLATQCANTLSIVVRPQISVERVDGKTLVVVYIPEVDAGLKPVYLKATGLPRGAYRRIGSSDQRCTDEDIWVLHGEPSPRQGPDQTLLGDARMDDFDPAALTEYRRLRERLHPHAEELSYGDDELLEALGAVRRTDDKFWPTLAGILLFGKSMALRRLLPMVRIDYIRVPGTEWIEDPHERFQAIEFRKALLLALPLCEASIVDELPKGFHLPEGQLQSIQEPIVPRKVIREALANAVMHRSYTAHSPIQIIRYSNRIEIRNAGYSLKALAELGLPGSKPRNPTIAAVLHDLNMAEVKGTGIRTMRRLAAEANLTLPEFHSSRESNEFRATLFLHNLLTEDDHAWLRSLTIDPLDSDEVKVLVYARATGAVDNTACRDFSGLDTLTASRVLRRLRDRGLLEKQGQGSATYYTLMEKAPALAKPTMLGEKPTMLIMVGSGKPTMLPNALKKRIQALRGERLDKAQLGALLLKLCQVRAFTAEELEHLLGKSRKYLLNEHLRPMVREGALKLLYPESAKHPHQAYLVPAIDPAVLTGQEPTMLDEKPTMLTMVGSESLNPAFATEGCNLELATFAPEVATILAQYPGRLSQNDLRSVLVRLCTVRPLTGEQLATLLHKDRDYLRNKHLTPMVGAGLLKLRYPESAHHPHQAYLPARDQEHEA